MDTSQATNLTIRRTAMRLTVNQTLNRAFAWSAAVLLVISLVLWGSWGWFNLSLWVPILVAVFVFCFCWLLCFRYYRVDQKAAAIMLDAELGTDSLVLTYLSCAKTNPFKAWIDRETVASLGAIDVVKRVPLRFPLLSIAYVIGVACCVWATPSAPVNDFVEGLEQRSADIAANLRKRSPHDQLIGEAKHLTEQIAQGLTSSSVNDVKDLKERMELALADEMLRQQLLEQLARFTDASKINDALAGNNTTALRLAIDEFAKSLQASDPAEISEAIFELGRSSPEMKTLLLQLDTADMAAFAKQVKSILDKLKPTITYIDIRKTAVELSALERDLKQWSGNRQQPSSSSGTGGNGGIATDNTGNQIPVDKVNLPARQWTLKDWERFANVALEQSSIEMTVQERRIVEAYFTRNK